MAYYDRPMLPCPICYVPICRGYIVRHLTDWHHWHPEAQELARLVHSVEMARQRHSMAQQQVDIVLAARQPLSWQDILYRYDGPVVSRRSFQASLYGLAKQGRICRNTLGMFHAPAMKEAVA